jgi:hypothetical protein
MKHERQTVAVMAHVTHSFNLLHFALPWKEAKAIKLSKPAKDPKFHQNYLCPLSLLSTNTQNAEQMFDFPMGVRRSPC